MIEKLNKTFISRQVLSALEMNDITGKVDELVDGVNLLEGANLNSWYGIEYDVNEDTSTCVRIGNKDLHKSLPLQSMMRRCIVDDDGNIVYYLNDANSELKEDGTPANLDGTDGQVMVPIWAYVRFEKSGTKRIVKMSPYHLPGFTLMGPYFIGAFEGCVDRTVSATPKLCSVINTTPEFRGGGNQKDWDELPKSQLGKPSTAISLTNFRTYARNRKEGSTAWNCQIEEAYRLLYWLYVVEYADRNSQLDFNSALTAEGFKQGGLSNGVTTLNYTKWNEFSGTYPVVPCGETKTLGNATGVVKYTMPAEYDPAMIAVNVPSYRGIENIFGHIWKWTDGVKFDIESEEAGGKSKIYICTDPSKYSSADNYDGYEYVGDMLRTQKYIAEILFDRGIMLPIESDKTASSVTRFCDYNYTNIPGSGSSLRGLLFGGCAANGAFAGFAYSYSYISPAHTYASFGSRLCFYSPSDSTSILHDLIK